MLQNIDEDRDLGQDCADGEVMVSASRDVAVLEEVDEVHDLMVRYQRTQEQIRELWLKKFDEMATEISRPLGKLELAIDRLGEDQGAFVERLLFEISSPMKAVAQQVQMVGEVIQKRHTALHSLLQANQTQNQAIVGAMTKLTERLASQQDRQIEILEQVKQLEEAQETARAAQHREWQAERSPASRVKLLVGALAGSAMALMTVMLTQVLV